MRVERSDEARAAGDGASGAAMAEGVPVDAAADRARMLRSARAVGIMTLVSRVTGLLRDNTQARFLGTGDAGDAFRVALLIPSLLRRLVGEGAVQSAFVPVLTDHARDAARFRDLAERLLTAWSLILAVVTVLGMGVSVALLLGLGPLVCDWPEDKLRLTASLSLGLFSYLGFIGLSAVAQGILNSLRVFALPAATPIVFNLCFVAAGWYYALFLAPGQVHAAWAFVAGVLAGGLLQFAVLVPALWRRGIRLRPRRFAGDDGLRKVLRLLAPATLGAGVYQVNTMVSTAIAMSVPVVGAVSSLYFSGRILELVLGIYVFAFSTVSLTTLSRQSSEGDLDGFRATLSEVLRLVAFITMPSMAGLLILAGPLIDILLVGGEFGADSRALPLAALYCYLPGLPFIGHSRVVVSAFYAVKDVWTPVRVGAVSFVANAVLSVALSRTPLGHAGLALASTIAALLQSALLHVALARRRGLIDGRGLLASALRSLAATAGMALACSLARWQAPPPSGRGALLVWLAGEILLGIVVYFALARLLRAPELATVLGGRRRRGDG